MKRDAKDMTSWPLHVARCRAKTWVNVHALNRKVSSQTAGPCTAKATKVLTREGHPPARENEGTWRQRHQGLMSQGCGHRQVNWPSPTSLPRCCSVAKSCPTL